jgi:RNA polymerase sigma-70 factor (ECF subfamily)
MVVRAQGGDEAAFAALATQAYGRLHQVAHGILRDRDRADDALQQALVTVWRELPRLRDPDRFEAWSHRVLVNACRGVARRESGLAARGSVRDISLELPGASALESFQEIADRDQLERGFRRLSVDHRAVVVLTYYHDLPAPRVADLLGIPIGTVHSRLHHAMRQLRAALQADARSSDTAVASETSR